jgi:hypothetical protein
MELITEYLRSGIEEIPYKLLLDILDNKDTVKVKTVASGMMVLSNNKVIKCASNYYKPAGETVALKKNFANNCFFAQKYLNMHGISNYECVRCHRMCLEKLEAKELKRRR